MKTFKTKEILVANYTPRRSLTDMKVLETAILKFQSHNTSFKKNEFENLWDISLTSKNLERSVENLKVIQFYIPGTNLDKEPIFNEIFYKSGMIFFDFSNSYKNHISPFQGMRMPGE